MPFSGSLFKTSTRLQDKTAQKRLADQHWRDVCRQVDRRDRYRCRACGRKVIATLARVPERQEHHHVIPKSLGGVDETWNIASLCLTHHEERHVTRTLSITGDANKTLAFTRAHLAWESQV